MLLFPLCAALRNIHAIIDGVNFLLCSEGDGGDGDGGDGDGDGAAAAAAAGLGTGDTGAPSDAGIGGTSGGGGGGIGSDAAATGGDNDSDSDPGTADSIGTSALSTQADAQAAMASISAQLGIPGSFATGTIGPSFGIDAGNLGLGYGNITGLGPTANLGFEGTNLGFSSPQAAINDAFGTINAQTTQNEQAAVDAVNTFGVQTAPPTAPTLSAIQGVTQNQMEGIQQGLFGISPTTNVNPNINAPPNTQVAEYSDPGKATLADVSPTVSVQAPVTAQPTQADPQNLPSITVDAPTNVPTGKSAPTTGPGDPGHGPGASPGQAAAAAAALGISGIATGPNDSTAAAPGFSVASFATPPDTSVDIGREGLLGKTISEQQADIDARDAKQQKEDKPALFDERFPVVPKSLEEQLKDIIVEIDKSLAKPSPPPAPPLDQTLTPQDKEAPHAVPAPPSPPISTPYGINPADDPNAITPSFSPAVPAPPAPPSPPISGPQSMNPTDDPNSITPSFSPAVPAPPSPPTSTPYGINPADDPDALTPPMPTDFDGRFGFPSSLSPQGVIGPSVAAPPSGVIGNPNISPTSPTTTAPPTTFSLPAPPAPVSNVPQNMTIPGTVAAPVPSTLSPSLTQADMDALAARALQSPVVAPPAPPPSPPSVQSLVDAAKQALQNQQNQPPPAPIGRGLNAPVGPPSGVIGPTTSPFGPPATTPGMLGSNITGFTPGSAIASIAANVGPVAAEAVSVGFPVEAAVAMQSLYSIPTRA